jgi:hypothetical protein
VLLKCYELLILYNDVNSGTVVVRWLSGGCRAVVWDCLLVVTLLGWVGRLLIGCWLVFSWLLVGCLSVVGRLSVGCCRLAVFGSHQGVVGRSLGGYQLVIWLCLGSCQVVVGSLLEVICRTGGHQANELTLACSRCG